MTACTKMRSFPFAAVFPPALGSLFVDIEERDPDDFTDLVCAAYQ